MSFNRSDEDREDFQSFKEQLELLRADIERAENAMSASKQDTKQYIHKVFKRARYILRNEYDDTKICPACQEILEEHITGMLLCTNDNCSWLGFHPSNI